MISKKNLTSEEPYISDNNISPYQNSIKPYDCPISPYQNSIKPYDCPVDPY